MALTKSADPELQKTITHTDTKWFGNEVMVKVGKMEVKLWMVIVGLVLLSIFWK